MILNWLNRHKPTYGADTGGNAAPAPASGDSGAPAPATTETVATPTPSASEPDAASPSEDLAFIFDEGETPSSPEPVAKTPPAPVVKAPEPAKPPAGAKAPEPAAKPVEAPKAPAAPAVQAPTEVTSAPQGAQLDPYDPGAIAQRLMENEAATIEHVAATMFKLTPGEIEALEADVVGTVPKLFAKAFVKSQHNMLQQLARLVPPMIQRHGVLTKKHSENESKFYSRWPDIKQDAHGALVQKYAVVYRQMHPEATLDSMIEAIGPMVMMAASIVPGTPGAPVIAKPASPMAPVGTRPHMTPFTPAGPNSGGASQSQPIDVHPVEAMFTLDQQQE